MELQPVEQAAYIKGVCTEDHILTVTVLMDQVCEHNAETWLSLVDFTKVFDTVEHATLWKVLGEQRVPCEYMALLQHLYAEQVAWVQAH